MSAGGIQLLQQSGKVAQTLGPGGVLEALVLGKDVDESVTRVVAVTAEQVPPALAKRRQHLPDLGVRTKLRHSALTVILALATALPATAPARPSSTAPGGRAIAPARRWAHRPGRSAPGTRCHPPGQARYPASPSDCVAAATGAARRRRSPARRGC